MTGMPAALVGIAYRGCVTVASVGVRLLTSAESANYSKKTAINAADTWSTHMAAC
jgi:hypothetical protein